MSGIGLEPLSLHPSHSVPVPTYRWSGVISATIIIFAWLTVLTFLLFDPTVTWLHALFGVPLLTFLYVGLFITAHDAMHGLVAPHDRWINASIGRLAVLLYALFSFDLLVAEHREHHNHPGSSSDPDFHDGTHSGLWAWYFTFMSRYMRWYQLAGIGMITIALFSVCGVSVGRVAMFFVVPSILSSVQLFYFGTYLPHHHQQCPFEDDNNARSNNYPVWLSFLTCYHFGYHLEHHRFPSVAWWQLPETRRIQQNRLKPVFK